MHDIQFSENQVVKALESYDPLNFKCEDVLKDLDSKKILDAREACILYFLKLSESSHSYFESRFLLHFDWDGSSIKMWEYMFKRAYFPVHVGQKIINGWKVSTVWLGLDLGFSGGESLIFETMVFKNDEAAKENENLENAQWRYTTYEKALEAHQGICTIIKLWTEAPPDEELEKQIRANDPNYMKKIIEGKIEG